MTVSLDNREYHGNHYFSIFAMHLNNGRWATFRTPSSPLFNLPLRGRKESRSEGWLQGTKGSDTIAASSVKKYGLSQINNRWREWSGEVSKCEIGVRDREEDSAGVGLEMNAQCTKWGGCR